MNQKNYKYFGIILLFLTFLLKVYSQNQIILEEPLDEYNIKENIKNKIDKENIKQLKSNKNQQKKNELNNKKNISTKNLIEKLRNQTEIFELKKLKRGMQGYGLSVFSGVKPELFKVKIIGIIQGDSTKSKLILARFSGANLEHTGIIAGMSGSPVYIQEKIIGAVSHAYPYSKDPIGAIRPIKEMLTLLEKKEFQKSKTTPIKFTPLESSLKKRTKIPFINKNIKKLDNYKTSYLNKKINLRPLATPILSSGIDQNVLNFMEPELKNYGLYPLKNGNGGQIEKYESKNISKELKPGDAVGILLVTGDLHLSALGTLSYKKGKKVLLLGHSAFLKGPINMPMSKEYIHSVIPTSFLSFKLSSTIFPVGKVYSENYSGVIGSLGKISDTIPIKIKIKFNGKENNYSYKIIKDTLMLPMLLHTTISQSIFNVSNTFSETSAKFHFKIKVKNLKTGKINLINTYDSSTGIHTLSNLRSLHHLLYFPLEKIIFNPFVKTEILEIVAIIDMSYERKITNLISMKILKNKIKAGDTLPILITMKNYKGEKLYQKVKIKIPKIINSKKLFLMIGNAKKERFLDRIFSKARFIPKKYDQLIQFLNQNTRLNDLVVWLDIPKQGLIIEGVEHTRLPSSMLLIMNFYKNKYNEKNTSSMLSHINSYNNNFNKKEYDTKNIQGKSLKWFNYNVNILNNMIIKDRIKKIYRSNYIIDGMLSQIITLKK